jgi:hypothetical protein
LLDIQSRLQYTQTHTHLTGGLSSVRLGKHDQRVRLSAGIKTNNVRKRS